MLAGIIIAVFLLQSLTLSNTLLSGWAQPDTRPIECPQDHSDARQAVYNYLTTDRWADARQEDGISGLSEDDVEALTDINDAGTCQWLNENFAPHYDKSMFTRHYYKAGSYYFVRSRIIQTEDEIRSGLGMLAIFDHDLEKIAIYMF